MTNKERAEKMHHEIIHPNCNSTLCRLTLYLTAQLDEACAEVERDKDKKVIEAYQTGLQRGFSAAREKAKGIADKSSGCEYACGEVIADRIAAMSPQDDAKMEP